LLIIPQNYDSRANKKFLLCLHPLKPIFMALIKSISGIRGTIGGKPGDTLSPLDVVRFTAAFGTWLTTI
jgi:hypothetical protein